MNGDVFSLLFAFCFAICFFLFEHLPLPVFKWAQVNYACDLLSRHVKHSSVPCPASQVNAVCLGSVDMAFVSIWLDWIKYGF